MEKFKALFVVIVAICVSQSVRAQTFSSDENRKVVEQILTVVINSVPFDSLYSSKKVYFEANELLTLDSRLMLKRKGCRAIIAEKEFLERKKVKYAVLGDFTLDWENPVSARVQISTMPEDALLSISLTKEGENWLIRGYKIFKE